LAATSSSDPTPRATEKNRSTEPTKTKKPLDFARNERIIGTVNRELAPRLGNQGLENKMTTFTLTNNFHNTESTVRPVAITEGRFSGYHKVSRATMLRLRRDLCGSPGCQCGGQFGERGGAYLQVIGEDYDRNVIVDLRGSHD